jgi:hypothetical protein
MSRIGLGRHRASEENVGDPLDGLVNLFDVGMILAIAFLIAGLGLTLHLSPGAKKTIPHPASAPHATGRGTPVGQVYRLPDGRLVYVKRDKRNGR